MNSTTLRLILLVLAGAMSTTAWAKSQSEPTCPVPNGVPCMSTIEVYRATNGADKVTSRAQGQIDMAPMAPMAPPVQQHAMRQAPPQPSGPVAYRPAEYAQLQVQGDSLVINNAMSAEAAPTHSPAATVEPYRVPAQIMQIYVAPWTDEQGDLHLPERVVTEIEPRHWALGAPAPDASTSFHLLELPSDAAKDSHPEVSANTSRGQSGNTAPTATTMELNR